jgi:glutamate-1-semialdehyde 2,1-aminomutase
MLCLYFTAEPVRSLADVTTSDRERWVRFFAGMLERGVLLPPSPYVAWFLSTEHDAGTGARVLEAAEGALAAVAR